MEDLRKKVQQFFYWVDRKGFRLRSVNFAVSYASVQLDSCHKLVDMLTPRAAGSGERRVAFG